MLTKVRQSAIAETRVYEEQLAMLYRHAFFGFAATLVTAGLLAVVIGLHAGFAVPASWWAAMASITLLRYLNNRAYNKACNKQKDTPEKPELDLNKWLWRFVAGVFCTGAGWGSAIVLFSFQSPSHYNYLVFLVVAVMVASAIPYLAVVKIAYLSYLLPVSLFTLSGHLDEGAIPLIPKVLLTVAYILSMWSIARMFNSYVTQSIRANAESRQLAKRLTASNQRLQLGEQRFRDFADTAADWFWETDDRLVFTYISEGFQVLTGYTPDSLIGRSMEDVIRTQARDLDWTALAEKIEARQRYEVEYTVVGSSGGQIIVHCAARPYYGLGGSFKGYRGVIRNITEERRLSDRLAYHATHDTLTGLLNRSAFQERLYDLLGDVKKRDTRYVLCLFDLDKFKFINDLAGHLAGDYLLRQVAVALRENIRKTDIFGRLGGDEFAVLLVDCSLDDAMPMAYGMIKKLQDLRFVWHGRRFSVHTSIGMVDIDNHTGTVEDILIEADLACYSAKRLGGNRVYAMSRSDEKNAYISKLSRASELARALGENRLRLYAQPIRAVRPRATNKSWYEILLRFADDSGNVLSPGDIIPMAEHYGQMGVIDRWVLNEILQLKLPAEVRLSINLSATSVNDPGMLSYVQEQLAKSKLLPEQICFEITETAAIRSADEAFHFIRTLKNIGCRFALDDFGSGLSSFAQLRQLPFDFLKIDGAYIKRIDREQKDHALVSAINQLGKTLGVEVIAESVENELILQVVESLAIDYAQGWIFGQPCPLHEIDEFSGLLLADPEKTKGTLVPFTS